MNKIIKDVLVERAQHTEAPHVDAAALIRSGRRRRTVRRGAGVGAVAAVAATVIAVAPTIVDRLPGGEDESAVNPASGLKLAWADGDNIYFGDDRIPRPAGYLDLTSYDGVVRYGAQEAAENPGDPGRGAIYEWRPSEAGEPERIVDNTVGSPLVEGDTAAWLEAAGSDQVRLVLKVGDAEYRTNPLPSTRNGPSIRTLDDSDTPTVTYVTGREVWSWNGTDNPVELDVSENKLIDRADGVTVVWAGWDDDAWTMRFLDEDGREISRVRNVGELGRLYDSGERYLTQSGQVPRVPVVVDVASGRSTSLDIGESNRGLQMTWDLDGNVLVATAPKNDDDAPVDLTSCDPTNGACEVIAEDVGKFSDVILAGETYGGL